jgi:hypothetical protein
MGCVRRLSLLFLPCAPFERGIGEDRINPNVARSTRTCFLRPSQRDG